MQLARPGADQPVREPGGASQIGGTASFQRSTTRLARSQPRTPIVAVSSAERSPGIGRLVQPAGGQDAQQMTVGEDQRIAVDAAGRGSGR